MGRTYNDRISKEANDKLFKREATVKRQKLVLAFFAITFILSAIILGSSIHAYAREDKQEMYKYYTNIRVEAGDTIWSIADDYYKDSDMSKKEYVNEICKINNISDGKIISGKSIIVSYYSPEQIED